MPYIGVRFGRLLIISGLSLMGLGVLFHLQGLSIVGPPSSFMYSNPEWVSYGLGVAVTGLVIVCAGVIIPLSKNQI